MGQLIYYNVCFHMNPIASFELPENAEKYAEREKSRRMKILEHRKNDLTAGEYRSIKRSVEYGLEVREVVVELQDRLD